MSEKMGVAVRLRERLPAVTSAERYVTYVYLEQADPALTSSELYKKVKNSQTIDF